MTRSTRAVPSFVCLHFTFRRVSRCRLSPLPTSSFSSRVLRACPREWRSERRRKRRTVHGKSEMRKSWMDGKDGRSVRERMGIWKGEFSRAPGMGSLEFPAQLKELYLRKFWSKDCRERERRGIDIRLNCLMIKRSKVGRKEDRFDGMARWIAAVPSAHRSPSFLLFSRRRREGNDAPRITNRPMPDRFFSPSS